MTTDTLDLEAIERRVEAATKGPWSFAYAVQWKTMGSAPYEAEVSFAVDVNGLSYEWAALRGANAEPNAAFIAHARTDVPALLAEVRRLKKANDHLRWATRSVGE